MIADSVFQTSASDGEALIAIAAFIAAVLVDYILWTCDRVNQILTLYHSKPDGA